MKGIHDLRQGTHGDTLYVTPIRNAQVHASKGERERVRESVRKEQNEENDGLYHVSSDNSLRFVRQFVCSVTLRERRFRERIRTRTEKSRLRPGTLRLRMFVLLFSDGTKCHQILCVLTYQEGTEKERIASEVHFVPIG